MATTNAPFNGTDIRTDIVVIGAGQAGLSVGYHLARRGLDFVILESSGRVGDSWRSRWDSLRLFTPARYNALAGMPFPAAPRSFPTKDEMADYLEHYAATFKLPVHTGVRVDEVTRSGDRYTVRAGDRRYHAGHVVVASASYQKPKIPAFAATLDPAITQLHSGAYRNPAQLRPGSVLLVGAAIPVRNSPWTLQARIACGSRASIPATFRCDTTGASRTAWCCPSFSGSCSTGCFRWTRQWGAKPCRISRSTAGR